MEAIVNQYELEVEAGIQLIREYEAMQPYLMQDVKDCAYNMPILEMKVLGDNLEINRFVRAVRRKYWTALFQNPLIVGNMTTNQLEEYHGEGRRTVRLRFLLLQYQNPAGRNEPESG